MARMDAAPASASSTAPLNAVPCSSLSRCGVGGDCPGLGNRQSGRRRKPRDHVIVSSGWRSYQAGSVEGGGSGTLDELGA